MIYQESLKRDVAAVANIPFETLAHMPYAEWAAIRKTYCGDNNRIAEVKTAEACIDCGGRNVNGPDFEGFIDCRDCGAAWIPGATEPA